jgi:hypothetical protein
MNETRVQWTGLVSNATKYTAKPGYVKVAENVVFERPNTASCRRGFAQFIADAGGTVKEIFEYDGKVHFYHGTTLSYWNGSAVVDYSVALTAASNGLQPIEWNDSLFVCTTSGVYKISSLGTAPVLSGVPDALGGTATASASTPWLDGSDAADGNGNAVAYRFVWGINDNNGRINLGKPSERLEFVLTPGSGLKSVALSVQIPDGITTSHFLQVYRSRASGSATDKGSDEMGQVFEIVPTQDNIDIDGKVDINDITTDGLIGATLYTSPTQEGILEGNSRPPVAKDIEIFREHAVYANIKLKHRAIFTLLGVSSTGFQVDDTVVIDGDTYTGKASESAVNKEFKVFTTGNASQNIADTARSLISMINQKASFSNEDYKAVYLSGFEDLPGKIQIERTTNAASSFTVSATTAVHTASASEYVFSPSDVEDSSLASDNVELPNAIMISKFAEFEAVPEKNIYECGDKDSAIERVVSISDRVFIFKDNGEVYSLTGLDNIDFTVQLFRRVKLYGANTLAKLNDNIYCFTDRGPAVFSQYGFKLIGEDIDEDMRAYTAQSIFPTFETTAWAMASESDGRYIMYTPADNVSNITAKMWVYQVNNQAWSNWTLNRASGFVRPSNDKIYMTSGSLVYQENKLFGSGDAGNDFFEDLEGPFTIDTVSADGKTITVTVAPARIAAGWSITGGNSLVSKVVSVTDKTIVIEEDIGLTTGTILGAQPIAVRMDFEVFGGQPGVMKQYREVQVGYRAKNQGFTIGFKNNFYSGGSFDEYDVAPLFEGNAWGDGGWAEYAWGGLFTSAQDYRIHVPTKYMNCLSLLLSITTEKAFAQFDLDKIVLPFEGASERFVDNATVSSA